MRVLHLTYHYGCASDLNYIFKKLGHDIVFFEATCWPYVITEEVANNIWNDKKEWFQSFDIIITSDTVALSLPFLIHFDELKPRLIIWICNRFNIFMENIPIFLELLKKRQNNISIIPYIEYERIWCSRHDIDILHEVINPLGMHTEKYLCNTTVMHRIFRSLNRDGQTAPDTDTFYIPDYHNNLRLLSILRQHQISHVHGRYMDVHELIPYKAVVSLPDAFGKIFYHEAIQQEIPVLIPSPTFFDILAKQDDYGVTSKQHETRNDIHVYCEYYKDKFSNCYIYYDSYDDLVFKLKNIDAYIPAVKQTLCKKKILIHDDILKQWEKVIQKDVRPLRVALYNGLNVHNEMIGHVMEYCKSRNHSCVIYSNTINYLRWIEFYRQHFGDITVYSHLEINPNDYDMIFLLTDDDTTLPNINDKKIVCIDHWHIIRRNNTMKRVDVRPFSRTVDDKWVLPVYQIIPPHEKAKLLKGISAIRVACVGMGGTFDLEKLKYQITNFEDIEFHVFVRCKEHFDAKDCNNIKVYIFQETSTMIDIIRTCHYFMFLPIHDDYYHKKMSGSLPLSFSLGCRIITSTVLKDLYKMSSCLVLDTDQTICLPPIDETSLDMVYNELTELRMRRDRWYDKFVNDIKASM